MASTMSKNISIPRHLTVCGTYSAVRIHKPGNIRPVLGSNNRVRRDNHGQDVNLLQKVVRPAIEQTMLIVTPAVGGVIINPTPETALTNFGCGPECFHA